MKLVLSTSLLLLSLMALSLNGALAAPLSARAASQRRVANADRCPAGSAEATASLLVSSGPQKTIRGGATAQVSAGLARRLQVGALFAGWYLLNVLYNISNKSVLNRFPKSLTVGWMQLGVGTAYVMLGWLTGLRGQPLWSLRRDEQALVAPVAAFHGLGQLATVVSLGAGAVSFTHIVKAMEPFFSAMASALVLRQTFSWQVYASLIPVVTGVSVAVAKDLSFNWLSLVAAMMSNAFFGLRSNWSKLVMTSLGQGRLSPANTYAVVTAMSFVLLAPLVLMIEGRGMGSAIAEAAEVCGGLGPFLRRLIMSGVLHYTNNEVMYLVLGMVHPVTLAVGNTLKRVVIIAAAVIIYGTPLTPSGIGGATVGILGVMLYSICRQIF